MCTTFYVTPISATLNFKNHLRSQILCLKSVEGFLTSKKGQYYIDLDP